MSKLTAFGVCRVERMRNWFAAASRRFLGEVSGTVAMEYALIAVLIAIGVLSAVIGLGETVEEMYETVAEATAG